MSKHILSLLTMSLLQGCFYFSEGTSHWYVYDEDQQCWEYEDVDYKGAWWHRYETGWCDQYSYHDFYYYSDDEGRCVGVLYDCGEPKAHDSPRLLPCEESSFEGCCEEQGWGGCD